MTPLSDAKASNAVDTRVEGVAFHPELGKGRASGWIHIDGDSIRFEPRDETEESIVLGLDDLELRLGGANDRVLFFSHPAQTETTFHTTDHSILEAPPLLARPALAEQVRAASAKKQRGRLLVTGVVVAVVAAALGLYQLKDPLAGVIAHRCFNWFRAARGCGRRRR